MLFDAASCEHEIQFPLISASKIGSEFFESEFSTNCEKKIFSRLITKMRGRVEKKQLFEHVFDKLQIYHRSIYDDFLMIFLIL